MTDDSTSTPVGSGVLRRREFASYCRTGGLQSDSGGTLIFSDAFPRTMAPLGENGCAEWGAGGEIAHYSLPYPVTVPVMGTTNAAVSYNSSNSTVGTIDLRPNAAGNWEVLFIWDRSFQNASQSVGIGLHGTFATGLSIVLNTNQFQFGTASHRYAVTGVTSPLSTVQPVNSAFGSTVQATAPFSLQQRLAVRMSGIGTTHTLKIWPVGTDEPTTPTMQFTSSYVTPTTPTSLYQVLPSFLDGVEFFGAATQPIRIECIKVWASPGGSGAHDIQGVDPGAQWSVFGVFPPPGGFGPPPGAYFGMTIGTVSLSPSTSSGSTSDTPPGYTLGIMTTQFEPHWPSMVAEYADQTVRSFKLPYGLRTPSRVTLDFWHRIRLNGQGIGGVVVPQGSPNFSTPTQVRVQLHGPSTPSAYIGGVHGGTPIYEWTPAINAVGVEPPYEHIRVEFDGNLLALAGNRFQWTIQPIDPEGYAATLPWSNTGFGLPNRRTVSFSVYEPYTIFHYDDGPDVCLKGPDAGALSNSGSVIAGNGISGVTPE